MSTSRFDCLGMETVIGVVAIHPRRATLDATGLFVAVCQDPIHLDKHFPITLACAFTDYHALATSPQSTVARPSQSPMQSRNI